MYQIQYIKKLVHENYYYVNTNISQLALAKKRLMYVSAKKICGNSQSISRSSSMKTRQERHEYKWGRI